MGKKYYRDDDFQDLDASEELYFENEFYENEPSREDGQPSSRLKLYTAIIVAITIVIGVISYGFKTEEVVVRGNKNYTEEEIKELIGFPTEGGNTLLSYIRYCFYRAKNIPFIEDIDVSMEGSNRICIEVEEIRILACIKEGKTYYYFDEDGIVKEVLSEKRERLPVIEGVDADHLEEGEAIAVDNRTVFKGMMELSELLLDYDVKAQKIAVDSEGTFTVYVDDAIRVGFGAPVYLEEKAAEMAIILQELNTMRKTEDIRGILHLENYDSTKNSIVFTKENEING